MLDKHVKLDLKDNPQESGRVWRRLGLGDLKRLARFLKREPEKSINEKILVRQTVSG